MLTWLFRPQCAACGAPVGEGAPLCGPCAGTLLELGPACPRCAEPAGAPASPAGGGAEPAGDGGAGAGASDPGGAPLVAGAGVLCGRCRGAPPPLEQIAAPWRFGGELATAIRRLKFAGRAHVARDLAPLWAPLVAAAAREAGAMGATGASAGAMGAMGAADPAGAIVVPVPLHWRRRLARGYDHAFLLARHACAAAGLPPPVAALRRARAAPPQSKLPAAARRTNLRGAFAVRIPDAVAGRGVVLVDDVVTTGATLSAAAAALRAAGAAAVLGVALARATSAPG